MLGSHQRLVVPTPTIVSHGGGHVGGGQPRSFSALHQRGGCLVDQSVGVRHGASPRGAQKSAVGTHVVARRESNRVSLFGHRGGHVVAGGEELDNGAGGERFWKQGQRTYPT